MVGKAHLADLAGGLLFCQPLHNAQALQPLPGFGVRQHVHQIVVHMVRFQPAQLLRKAAVQILRLFQQIVGELGSNVYLLPDAVPGEDFPQGGFAAGIDVGSIEIIDASVKGFQDLFFGFGNVDFSGGLGKAHTAVAQYRDGVAIAVFTVLHGRVPPMVFSPL